MEIRLRAPTKRNTAFQPRPFATQDASTDIGSPQVQFQEIQGEASSLSATDFGKLLNSHDSHVTDVVKFEDVARTRAMEELTLRDLTFVQGNRDAMRMARRPAPGKGRFVESERGTGSAHDLGVVPPGKRCTESARGRHILLAVSIGENEARHHGT
jgi:hypothetical protein